MRRYMIGLGVVVLVAGAWAVHRPPARWGRPDYSRPVECTLWDHKSSEPNVPKKLPLGARRMLDRNGFVVMGDVEAGNITHGYFSVHGTNFISADAVLYVFHCLFRGGLTTYEKQKLLPQVQRLATDGLVAARAQRKLFHVDPILDGPTRRNVIFFAVAKALLDGQPPTDEPDEVGKIVAKTTAASEAGFYPAEDYTTYKPRGAYADDPDLARYFRAMTWFGRVILPIIPGAKDAEPEASEKLRQAFLLAELLHQGELRKTWQTVYDEISFLIAKPDSFTPLQSLDALANIPGPPDDRWVAAVRAEFSQPQYPESKIIPVLQGSPGDAPTKYVQFMGARYIPDGQIHQEVTYPYVGRTLPKGLDIGYALFDSDRARVHLADEFTKHAGLDTALDRLHGLFSQYGAETEPQSVYGGWVGALREVLKPPASPNVPACFATEAWRDKSLNTALASWAEMRHDFVLYTKAPNAPKSGGRGTLVEPVPGAYERLATLAQQLSGRGFAGMGDFAKLCRVLKLVSGCELAGVDWLSTPEFEQAHADLPHEWESWDFYLGSFAQWLMRYFTSQCPAERTCIAVDVASDSNPPQRVLHEATGPLNLIVIKGGLMGEYQGWALSYYEFTEDHSRRLTDAEWGGMVNGNQHRVSRPEWTKSYLYGH